MVEFAIEVLNGPSIHLNLKVRSEANEITFKEKY